MAKAPIELNPCPECNGKIKIYLHCAHGDHGAFAHCTACKKKFKICGMDQIPTYNGIHIRKSTADKIRRMWNRSSAMITGQKDGASK